MSELPSGTVTFLFTDIEGSTRLLKTLGDAYAEVLAEHQRLLREAFAAHGGHEIDTQGDSFFVAFRRARDAVAAAVAAQRALSGHPWPEGVQVRVRMGLHSGEPNVGADRYTGLGVHRAARVAAVAHGGQILLSETTRSLVEDDLPPAVRLRELGRVALKDFERPERVAQLVVEGLPSTFPRPKAATRPPLYRRRSLLFGALAGVVAAAVAIPIFALGQGSSGGGTVRANAVAIVDPGSNRVTGEVAVGARPGAIAAGAGSVWVANLDDQTISQIDPRTRAVVRSIAVAGAPTGLAATTSAVWVVTADAGRPTVTVDRIDPQFGSVAGSVGLGNVEPGGPGAASASGGEVWVAPSAGLLTRIDAGTGRAVRTVDPRSGPTAVAVGAGAVWVADAEGNSVTRVDPTGLVAPIPVGNGPSALAVDGKGVWVAESLDDAVVRIDPATHAVSAAAPVGQAPAGIALGGGSVWVANGRDGTVTRLDSSSGKLIATIRVGGSPRGLVFADGRLWVTVDEAAIEAQPGSGGGDLRISQQEEPDFLDPALAFGPWSWQLLNATCVKLVNYPDKPAPAGAQLEPEAARSLPTVSDGGRTYTFRIRRGFRFSPPSHEAVTAQTFRFTLERSLSKRMNGPARDFLGDVAGAKAYIEGRAPHIAGITARGDTLTIRLVRPAPDLVSRLALPFFCAVPLNTPLDPKGVRVIPGAGPYHVSSYTPGQGAVLVRNPRYSGARPHHFARMIVTFRVKRKTADAQIEAGKLDYALDGVDPGDVASLERRFGAHSPAARLRRRQFFVTVQPALDYLTLNTTRGTFADARVRRAASLAVDRKALAAVGSPFVGSAEVPTAAYLPPGMPGYVAAGAASLRPDLKAARRLAGRKHRTAVFYTCTSTGCARIGQIVKTELARIGIAVEVRAFSIGEMFTREVRPGEPFDIAIQGWLADYLDPGDFLDYALATPGVAGPGFHDEAFVPRLAAVAQLAGPRRYLAYGRLAVALARDSAPWIAFGNETTADFFSARIGCQVAQPTSGMDLAALCLRS